jgi:hypothetical protein
MWHLQLRALPCICLGPRAKPLHQHSGRSSEAGATPGCGITYPLWEILIGQLSLKELYPYLNSAAFVLECSKGRGRLVGSFVEHTPDAGSYRGELLGLMAIHLILQGVNEVRQGLQGLVHIFSDCLGALNKVENLPPYRIPTQCSHSDILKEHPGKLQRPILHSNLLPCQGPPRQSHWL